MRVARNRFGGWDAIIEGVDPATKRRRRVYRSGRTQKEAKERLAAYLEQVRAGMGGSAGKMTVAQYLHSWKEMRKPDVTANTWRAYDQHLRLYVVPALGKIRLCDLTATDIRGMLAGLEKSQRTRHHALMTLNAALNHAADDGLIAKNPARRMKVSKGRSQTASLTVEQAGRLLDACEAEDSLYADAVAFALLTGLRHGEVLGLRWVDVRPSTAQIQNGATGDESRFKTNDVRPLTITVSQALQRVTGQGMVVRPPKTEAGERTIALGPQAAAVLSRVKGRQKVVSIGAVASAMPDVAGRFFHGDRGGQPRVDEGKNLVGRTGQRVANREAALVFAGVKETALRRHFKILLARADIPQSIRFHDLRHSWATLARPFLDTRGIADHLGHADPGITARLYQHHVAAINAEAVMQYEAQFSRGGDEAGREAEEA